MTHLLEEETQRLTDSTSGTEESDLRARETRGREVERGQLSAESVYAAEAGTYLERHDVEYVGG